MPIDFKIEELDFLKNSHESMIKDESLLGLGRHHFNPQNNTMVLYAYSDEVESIINEPRLWYFNTTLAHEMGHYILTGYSRFGRMIRDLNSVQNGVVFLILQRMIRKHNRLWIPFDEYLQFENKCESTAKLIRDLYGINRFGNELVQTWKVSQELFAYSWSGLFNTVAHNTLSSLFDIESEQDYFKFLLSMNTVFGYEEEKIDRILSRIDTYLRQAYAMNWSEIPVERLGSIIDEIIDNSIHIFGFEDKDTIRFLKSIKFFAEKPLVDSKGVFPFQYDEEVMKNFHERVDPQFQEDTRFHMEALQVLEKCASDNPLLTMANVMLIVGIASCIYAPRITPEQALARKSTDLQPLKQFNSFLTELPKLVKGNVTELSEETITSLIPTIQALTGSVGFADFHEHRDYEIVGTDSWNLALVNKLGLGPMEEAFIKKVLKVNKYTDFEKNLIFPLRMMWPLRVLIRLGFTTRTLLSRIGFANKAFSFLQKLNIDSYNHAKQFLNIYKDLLSLPFFLMVKFEKSAVLEIPIIVSLNGKSLNLHLDKELSSETSRMALLRQLEGSLREACMARKQDVKTRMVLCPYSFYDDLKVSVCGAKSECWFVKLLRRFGCTTTTLICPKGCKAEFDVPVTNERRDTFILGLNVRENCNFEERKPEEQPAVDKNKKSIAYYYRQFFGDVEEVFLREKQRFYEHSFFALMFWNICRISVRVIGYAILTPCLLLIDGALGIIKVPLSIYRKAYDFTNICSRWSLKRALKKSLCIKLSILSNSSKFLDQGL